MKTFQHSTYKFAMAAFCLFAKVPFWTTKPNHYATFKIQASCKKSTSPGLLVTKVKPYLGYFPSGKKWRRGTHVLPHSRHAFRIVVFLDNVVDDLWYNVVDKWNSLQNSQLQRCLFPKPNYMCHNCHDCSVQIDKYFTNCEQFSTQARQVRSNLLTFLASWPPVLNVSS